MIVILVLSVLGTGGYFGYDKVKTETRKDAITQSCLNLSKAADDTKHCIEVKQ